MSVTSITRLGLSGLGLLVTLSAGTGCAAHRMGLRAADDRLSIQVNVVLITEAEKDEWQRLAVDEYWKPKGGLRESEKYKSRTRIFLFGANQPAGPRPILNTRDKEYGGWRKAKYAYVVILADRPPRPSDGADDCRRRIVPMDPDRWDAEELEFTVTDSCIDLRRPARGPATPK